LKTPDLEEKHKKSEKRQLGYIRLYENKNHKTSEN
jgi:hypothetical protein